MTRLFSFASHMTALLALCGLSCRLRRNLSFLRHARRLTSLPAVPPRVSVLIPARNEARTIAACVESLASQCYPNFEIIALDDQSCDGTGALLDELAARCPGVTVLHGRENPPAGWNGKSYACYRLSQQAAGDWLLFTDADTVHAPTSIAHGITQAEGLGADLLSAFPRQITKTWSERIVVSFILDFLPLVGLDLDALWRGTSGAAANGQYVLARAAAYHAVGGHSAIFDALVDDFALAKQFQSSGYKTALVDGTSLVSCRMYHSAREVWEGFSKNILLALSATSAEKRPWWWGLAFAWGYAAVFVLPFYHLLYSRHKWLPLLELGWLAALRGVVNRQFGRSSGEVILTPLAAWSVMAFGIGAWFRRRRGKVVRWKGRDYALTR